MAERHRRRRHPAAYRRRRGRRLSGASARAALARAVQRLPAQCRWPRRSASARRWHRWAGVTRGAKYRRGGGRGGGAWRARVAGRRRCERWALLVARGPSACGCALAARFWRAAVDRDAPPARARAGRHVGTGARLAPPPAARLRDDGVDHRGERHDRRGRCDLGADGDLGPPRCGAATIATTRSLRATRRRAAGRRRRLLPRGER